MTRIGQTRVSTNALEAIGDVNAIRLLHLRLVTAVFAHSTLGTVARGLVLPRNAPVEKEAKCKCQKGRIVQNASEYNDRNLR